MAGPAEGVETRLGVVLLVDVCPGTMPPTPDADPDLRVGVEIADVAGMAAVLVRDH